MDPNYISLNAGEKIQKFDEYKSNNDLWRDVPEFLIGDKVIESSHTKWRRKIINNEVKKEKWYDFILKIIGIKKV
jgi:hypothetical protein